MLSCDDIKFSHICSSLVIQLGAVYFWTKKCQILLPSCICMLLICCCFIYKSIIISHITS